MQTATRVTRTAPKAAPPAQSWYNDDGGLNWSQIITDLGVGLAALAFGIPLFIVNGGLSVQGLGAFLVSLGSTGQTAWDAISVWQMNLPNVRGLPHVQPVLPWIGVVAATICQIMVAWLKRQGRPIPQRLAVAVLALSIYDLATTFNGTSEVSWIVRYGWVAQVPAALFITFAFEIALGVLLAAWSNAARREQAHS